jgi:hypothetical protein
MEFEGQYLTYDEYEELGGDLPEMPFNLLEFEARQEIDKYTFGRLKELATQVNDVKLCVYKIISYINNYNQLLSTNGAITSENTDGYSISYSKMSSSDTDTKNNVIKDIVKTYLIDCKLDDGTPYLYCGADK